MTSTATYQCDVQPPTPIMATGSFAEYVEAGNQCQAHLNTKQQPQQLLRRNSSTHSGSFGHSGHSGSSYDLSGEDTLSNSGNSSHSGSHTHDPYQQRASFNGSTNGYPQYQQSAQSQQDDEYYQQQQAPSPMHSQHSGMGQQQYNGQQLPPSLQLASQGRQRDQQQQQSSNDDLFPAENLTANAQPRHPYPQQSRSNAASSFVAHTTEAQTQQHTTTAAASQKPFPECCYHKALVNRMEFIQPPTVTAAGNFGANTRSNNYLRVFVGQCRFEATPAEVRWLIHYLTQVQPVKVELRGTGCFMAYVQSYEEVHALLQLKEKLLFDHTGVWYARDEEQCSFLRRYVQTYVSAIGKGFRLPKDMVVLKDQQEVQQRHQQQHHNGGNGMMRYNNHGQQQGQGGFPGQNQRQQHQNQGQGQQQSRSNVNNFYGQQQQQAPQQQQYYQ